jgi:hypothetical protein
MYGNLTSGHQQRWSRPLPGANLIPPALLVVADFENGAASLTINKIQSYSPTFSVINAFSDISFALEFTIYQWF